MTTFLGPVGSLIPVKCASQLSSSGGREVSFTRTLGKQKAFLGRVTAREWSVDIGLAKPHELSGLRWLAENTTGPLVWYSTDAVVGNVLTPRQAAFTVDTHNGLEGPLVEVEPGLWVKSAMPNSSDYFTFPRLGGPLDPIPIVSGRPVTISAWLRGQDARFSVSWFDTFGNTVTGGTGTNPRFNLSSLTRVSRTVTPPDSAVGVTVWFYAEQTAGPAVTFSDRLLPYSPGRGAPRVVVHGLADAVLRATEDQQLQSLSFTVSEVG